MSLLNRISVLPVAVVPVMHAAQTGIAAGVACTCTSSFTGCPWLHDLFTAASTKDVRKARIIYIYTSVYTA